MDIRYISSAGYQLWTGDITTVSGFECELVLWNGTGLFDTGGDWTHSGYGSEATYADRGYGTNGLDASSFNNEEIIFTSTTNVNVDDYVLLSIWLNVKNWTGGQDVSVYFNVGNSVNLSDYVDIYSYDTWQQILISLSEFGLSAPIELNELTLESNGDIGFYLDDIEFAVGVVLTSVSVIDIGTPDTEAEPTNRPSMESVEIDYRPSLRAFTPPENL